ncbi:MAG: response regulator [Kiritimatiellia bacterium]|nr:response regulator [Lentisphaerota bacterium]
MNQTTTSPDPISEASQDSGAPLQQEDARPQPCAPQTLLLADDEEMIRKLFLRILTATFPGLQVEAAANGRLALESFKQQHHQIVILDVSMPEMDGIKAGRAIISHCSEQKWMTPHLVFCSGSLPTPELIDLAGDETRHIILKKPVTSNLLIETLQKLISSP